MGKSGQVYSQHQAMIYRNVPGLSESDDPVEFTINRWLKARLDAELPNSGIVGDIGCGSGRLFPIIEGQERVLFGIDASQAMLEEIPENYRSAMVASFEAAITRLFAKQSAILCADCISSLRLLETTILRLNAAISSFIAICFADPDTLISAIAPVMAQSARLFLASNIFVDSTIADKLLSTLAGEGFVGPTIDIFNPSLIKELPPAHSQFRHVLYTRAAKVPLQDYVHDIAMYVRAFRRDLWRIEEARLFRPDGCEHVFSDTHAPGFDQGPGLFLEPSAPFSYLKIGIIVRRLG